MSKVFVLDTNFTPLNPIHKEYHISFVNAFTQRMVICMQYKRFVNCSTVPLIVCAGTQNYSREVSQLTLHSSHHQTEYSFGGGLLEEV
ncbi:hypothetical protein NIES80_11960 [Dolichospermum planctonicum]|uniref:Uncharacterized protein n=1 Tax=Dolichospermum planctonicum TaxID=136072 RepID=A0A480AEG7_9CYAN|nr:hypothetical protein NIES80_11960 [Dolichospermum planctonicum]